MAEPIRRLITAVFDRASAQKVEGEMVRSLESAGQKGGEGFLRELRSRFNSRIAHLREELASGVIDQREFRKQSELAGKAFNDGLLSSIRAARAEGKLTDGEYVKLARNFKRVGEEGGTAWDKIKGSIIRAGSALALYFGARQIMAFGKSTIAAAGEAEAVWTQLGGTLEGVGVNFADVRGELEAAAIAMQDTTTFGDEDFARALQNLTLVSGDYAASLKNVGLVADLAAAKNINFEQATEILGKALAGNTLSLTKMFPTLRGSADIIGDLTVMLDGQAELMRGTWAGGVKALGEGWGNLKEEIGKAMIEAGGGSSVLETLIGVVRALTFWIAENQKGLQFWIGGGLKVAIGFVTGFYRALTVAINGITGFGAALVDWIVRPFVWVLDGFAKTSRAVEKFWELVGADRFAANARRSAENLERYADAFREVADEAQRAARASFGAAGAIIARTTFGSVTAGGSTSGAPGVGGPTGTGGDTTGGAGGGGGSGMLEGITVTAQGRANTVVGGRGAPGVNLTPLLPAPNPKTVTEWDRVLAYMGTQTDTTAAYMTKSFEGFFTALFTGFDATKDGFHSLADAAVGLGAGMVSSMAEGWATFSLARGTAALAEGAWPPNPAALFSATKWFAAAGMFKALGGQLAGAGRSAGNGAVGAPGEIGRRAVDNSSRPTSEVTIYINPLNPTDPAYQRNVKQATDFAAERYPGKVTVKPYPVGMK